MNGLSKSMYEIINTGPDPVNPAHLATHRMRSVSPLYLLPMLNNSYLCGTTVNSRHLSTEGSPKGAVTNWTEGRPEVVFRPAHPLFLVVLRSCPGAAEVIR